MKGNSIKEYNKGCLVISLDFELMWGMLDLPNADIYKESNVRQVPLVIEELLSLFTKYGIHATFATVGFIFFKDSSDLLANIPTIIPSYSNQKLNPYLGDFIKKIAEEDFDLFFQPGLIDRIKETEGMEIGTHTFSHYYCWEKGQNIEQFEEDICKAKNIGEINGMDIKSIIFPRNNVSDEYLTICKKYGITTYRGNPKKFFNQSKNKFGKIYKAGCRLFDNYINLSGKTSFSTDDIRRDGMTNIRASRMLRPVSTKLRWLEPLRLKRIKNEMTIAAKKGEIYHLWWHPHNFGANIKENLVFLEELLKHYKYLNEKYGMKSLNMGEF